MILIDLGPGVFDNATVDTNILLIQKKNKDKIRLKAITLNEKDKIDNLTDKDFVILTDLGEESWIILSPVEQKIKQRIEEVGIPLREWDINIYRGVLTGYNEAFIIDGKTKEELIKRPEISGDNKTDFKRKRYKKV